MSVRVVLDDSVPQLSAFQLLADAWRSRTSKQGGRDVSALGSIAFLQRFKAHTLLQLVLILLDVVVQLHRLTNLLAFAGLLLVLLSALAKVVRHQK